MRVKDFGSGANPASYCVGNEGFFPPRVNRPGREADHNTDRSIYAIRMLHKGSTVLAVLSAGVRIIE
jgi:hypothetical protein